MKTMIIAAATVLGLGTGVALAQGAPSPSFKAPQYGSTAWGNERQALRATPSTQKSDTDASQVANDRTVAPANHTTQKGG